LAITLTAFRNLPRLRNAREISGSKGRSRSSVAAILWRGRYLNRPCTILRTSALRATKTHEPHPKRRIDVRTKGTHHTKQPSGHPKKSDRHQIGILAGLNPAPCPDSFWNTLPASSDPPAGGRKECIHGYSRLWQGNFACDRNCCRIERFSTGIGKRGKP